MIIKPYEARDARDPRLKAGVRAEKQMAHYLDRHFKDSDRFLVLHDLRFEFEGDTAQIDHLVIHPFGVAIIESKSVSTAVRINHLGEWERQWKSSWMGMPDPLLQGERQGKLLRLLLYSRETELLDRFLMGTIQGTFTFMAVDVFAAISDDGRIERAGKKQAPNARKADSIPRAVEEVVDRHRRDNRLLGNGLAALVNAPRDFNKVESLRIARFLHARHRVLNEPPPEEIVEVAVPKAIPAPAAPTAGPVPGREITVRCKSCGGRELEAMIGKYGPYAKCRSCGKNTAVREACEACRTQVYLSRDGAGFTGTCGTCGGHVSVAVGDRAPG